MEKHLASLPRSPPPTTSFGLPPWLVQRCTEGGEHLTGSLASTPRIKCCFSIGVGFYFFGISARCREDRRREASPHCPWQRLTARPAGHLLAPSSPLAFQCDVEHRK